MNRQQTEPAVAVSRGYTPPRLAYVFFCGSIVFTVALLTLATFVLPPRALPMGELPSAGIPLATIQLLPNRDGQCRNVLFHNESGRFEDGGRAKCRGLIPDELLLDSVRANRNEAIGRVFKIR